MIENEFENYIQKTQTISLTPMIDVVFILLLFFILSSASFLSKTVEIDQIKSTQKSNILNNTFDITIDSMGVMFINSIQMSKYDLKMRVKKQMAKNPETSIIIHPDKITTSQDLIKVMDLCKSADAKKISIGVLSK